ncbi:putative quinol monooxygenase [soil metagenome]
MTPLIILVDFKVNTADHDKFRRLITENAAASLKNEPGCRQFDVLVPEGDGTGHFILYEIYDSDAAFAAHLRTEHFRQFDSASAPMIVEKTVSRLRVVEA